MAEFRRRCINFEDSGNIVDKKHAPDPSGFALAAARETVSIVAFFPQNTASALMRHTSCLFSAMPVIQDFGMDVASFSHAWTLQTHCHDP